MKTYTSPEINITVIKNADIITTSTLANSASQGLTQTQASINAYDAGAIDF